MKQHRLTEETFHDRWAASVDLDRIGVADHFEAATAPENRFIVDQLGDVRGKTLLDLGCGLGENSTYFGLRGARCVAVDLSAGMLSVTRRLASRHGVSVACGQTDASSLPFADGRFDIVYAANLLHHVPDLAGTLTEIHRVLREGGKACFWDPLRHNPLINVYRRIASGVRSRDEAPLGIGVVDDVARLFSRVEHDTFWLASLWIFIRFYLIERVDPNEERYWKKIITEHERLAPSYRRLERVDRLLKRWPWLRRFAWNLACVATK